jgi:hypothetical protein
MVREIRPVQRDDLDELTFAAPALDRPEPATGDRPARRPEQSATFEPQPLSRRRGAFPTALAGWLGVLALVVAAGFAGQRAEDSHDRSPAQVALASPEAPAVLLPDEPENPIDLLSPEIGPITVTTARLTVKGTVLVHAARVVVSLEARGNRTLDSVTFNVSDPDGGIRPKHKPSFSAEFDIPFPRPNGTMWVVVTAYDSHLIPLGGERRPVVIGEIMGWPAAPGVG